MLIDTDVRATARLVLLDFPLDLAEITYKLQANPAEQFNFLQGIFDPKFVSLLSYGIAWRSSQCFPVFVGLRRSKK